MKHGNTLLNARIAGLLGLFLSMGVLAGPPPESPTAPPTLTRPVVPEVVQPAAPSATQPIVMPGTVQPVGTAISKPLPGPPVIWVFANPVAKVLGPTSVELAWRAREGATGYRVWRNGVAIVDIPAQPASQSIVDTMLVPVFANTYKVWAMQAGRTRTRDPLGILLEESGPAYASSSAPPSAAAPAHMAPTNIKATIVAAGANNVVQLTWNAAAGAQAYFMFRDGTLLSSSVTGTSYNDSGLPDGSHTYSLQSFYPTADGKSFDMSANTRSKPVRIRIGPLNVVAVGDSVMWGQGLADLPGNPHKFTTIVHDWLQTRMGTPVMLNAFAHSGAIVTPGTQVQEAMILPGEIPSSFPTVGRQALSIAPAALARLGVTLNDVDLVLVDGCTNDIGITTILNPSIADSEIANTTMKFCSSVTKLLVDIHTTYPNAAIVVTGYFPIVTPSSDIHAVGALAVSVGAIVGPAAAALAGVPLDPVSVIVGLGITYEVLRQTLIGHSNTYIGTSNAALSMAAATVNAQLRGGWVTFVSPPFSDVNAYSSPVSWLWPIPSAVTGRDEVYAQRQQDCAAAMLPSDGDNAKCVIASIGHPNILGAKAYADAITMVLPKFLPQWKQTLSIVQTAP